MCSSSVLRCHHHVVSLVHDAGLHAVVASHDVVVVVWIRCMASVGLASVGSILSHVAAASSLSHLVQAIRWQESEHDADEGMTYKEREREKGKR